MGVSAVSSGPLELTTAFFRSVAEASPDCIRILSLDGRVEYMNRRGQDLLEIADFTTIHRKPWASLWGAEYADEITRCIHEAAAGRPCGLRAAYTFKDGRQKWFQSDLRPIDGDDGEPIGILAISRDISAEVENATVLREVLQQLPAPVLIKRASDGRFVLVNKAAEDVLGMPAEALIGKTVFDFVIEEQAIKFSEEDAEVIRSRQVQVEEEELITTVSRGERYYVTKKMATFDDHGPSHIFTIFEDVTEQRESRIALAKALADAEQANRAKSAFLANMSHEIRTPLNGVIAVADLLARSALDERQRELVSIIQGSGATLRDLLTDILDLAKIESGQLVLECAPFDLGELVQSVSALHRMRAEDSGLQLVARVSADVAGLVSGDQLRIRQVLGNLLSNAIKFTSEGEVSLTVERIGAGDRVRFTVEDTGIGFDQDFKARIFGRFQQADASITRKFGGTGLGLSICFELAALMGGSLDCDSTPGQGARFWLDIDLPRVGGRAALPAPQTPAAAPEPHLAEDDTRLRVLVADDHPVNRRVVGLLLGDVADVTAVENGAEAVEIVEREPFDLVLMDMQMPVMDGLTAVRAIRRSKGPAARLPIIVLSANAMSEHVAASLEAGADAHLGKPVTGDALMRAIADLQAPEPPLALSA